MPRKKEYVLKIFSDIRLFLFYFLVVAPPLTNVGLQSRTVRSTGILFSEQTEFGPHSEYFQILMWILSGNAAFQFYFLVV